MCVCVCVLTALAVHVGVALAAQHAVFVRHGVEQDGDGNEGVMAVRYPGNALSAALALLLHQLRQTLPQLLLLPGSPHAHT